MTETLNLTEEMRVEIAKLAERFDVSPELVLRRMVFSYAAKFEEYPKITGDNVVSIVGSPVHKPAVNSGESGEE